MIFENAQLNITELPQYQESDYHALEEKYLRVLYLGTGLIALVPLIPIIVIFITNDYWSNIGALALSFGGWLIYAIVLLVLVRPRFNQKGYALREKDISYQKGLVTRRTTTIPFNRVQHCDISQGPISRYFGLSKLNVYTAGGANSDLSIPGLSQATAAQMMDFVLQKTLQADEEE